MIRVVLADDQPLVRTGLRMILSAVDDIEVVGEAADGAEAISVCAELSPDVVLMDVRMPGVDGIDATRAVTATDAPPKVLVLTTFDLDDVVYEAFAPARADSSSRTHPRNDSSRRSGWSRTEDRCSPRPSPER